MTTPNNPLTRDFQRKLQRLHRFGEIVETTLVEELRQLNKEMTVASKGFTPEARIEFFEYHAEDYVELSDELPTVLRYSVLTAADTALEVYLNDTCETFARVTKAKLRLGDLRNAGIQRARHYLKKVAGVDFPDQGANWQAVVQMHALRNSIIHADGVVEISRDDLRRWSQNVPGLRISDTGVITLDRHFIAPALGLYEAFVHELDAACESLGLWVDEFPPIPVEEA